MHRFALLLVVGMFACKSKSAAPGSSGTRGQDTAAKDEDKTGGAMSGSATVGGAQGSGSSDREDPKNGYVDPRKPGGEGGGGGDAGVTRPLDHNKQPVTDDVGQVVAVGSLDQSLIRRQIKKNIADVNKCYQTAVATNPTLHGTIVTKFTIKPDGSVIDAKANGLDDALGRCVSKVIEQITFPKPKNGDKVTVTYPFQFRLSTDAGSGSGSGIGSGTGSG